MIEPLNGTLAVVIFVLLLIGSVIEYFHDKKQGRVVIHEYDYAWIMAALLAFIIAFVIVASTWNVQAHDYAHPELNPWLESLHSRSHTPCCDDQDTTHVDDLDWGTQEKPFEPDYGASTQLSHFWVNIDGHKVDVPDEAIVDEPNREGHALVWYYRDWASAHPYKIRCFMPGTMS